MSKNRNPQPGIDHPPQPPRANAREAVTPAQDDGAREYSGSENGGPTRGHHHLHDAAPKPKTSAAARGNTEHADDAKHPGDTVAGSDGTPPASKR